MGEKPDGKTLAVNLHFYLTFNTMLTVIINTFLQDSSFFTAKKKKREGGGKNCIRDALWTLLDFFFQKVFRINLNLRYQNGKNWKEILLLVHEN